MDKFQQRFIDEAGEYFESLELALINLESDFSKIELVEEVFRIMHSLKGSGAMFGFNLLSEATHDLESLYDQIRIGSIQLNSTIISFTLQSLDLLRKLLVIEVDQESQQKLAGFKADIANILSGRFEKDIDVSEVTSVKTVAAESASKVNRFFIHFKPHEEVLQNGTNPLYLIDELHSLGTCSAVAYFEDLPDFKSFEPEKCYTSWRAVLETSEDVGEIEDVFLFVKEEGVLNILPILNESVDDSELQQKLFELPLEKALEFAGELYVSESEEELTATKTDIGTSKSISSIRVNSRKIDEYMNLVSEMITAQSRLMLLSEDRNDQEMIALAENFQKLIRQLRDNAFNMSLVPLFNMMARFKRLVRDLSAELKKEVELVTEGLDTEVDKNMIEQLTDPMLHIIRNCIDHGIESPDKRIKTGKQAKGTIHVKASYVGTFVQVEIKDDGAGLNFDRIKNKAIERGLLEPEAEPDYSELIQLIFEPGFSTTTQVSDLSGRGVGMDVTRQAIKNLRGEVEVDSTEGEGTHITLRVPLTLSIIDGLLTNVDGDYFVIPTSNIEKIYALKDGKKSGDLRQVIVFDGQEIPYLNLRQEFKSNTKDPDNQYLIAIGSDRESLFGLIVDDVLREYQAVVKPLGKMLKHHDMFFGASILGDGKIALVIDTKKVIQNNSAWYGN